MRTCGASLTSLLLIAGCRALPPPPLVTMQHDTAADPRGETTGMLVVGIVTEGGIGGSGFGLAFRVEHQQTDRTAVGVEIAGGAGDGGDRRLYLIAVRGYGRTTPRSHNWIALTYGLGFTALNTEMLTLGVHGGGAVSYPNETASPYLHIGLAGVLPIRKGRAFGSPNGSPVTNPEDFQIRPSLFKYGEIGLVVPVVDTGNELSAALAGALGAGAGLGTLTVGASKR
jgi:hypothetical protein